MKMPDAARGYNKGLSRARYSTGGSGEGLTVDGAWGAILPRPLRHLVHHNGFCVSYSLVTLPFTKAT